MIDLPAWKLQELLNEKKISATELLEAFIRQTEITNPDLNALLYFNPDEIRSQKGSNIPIVISDVINWKGTPSTFGSLLLKNSISREDSNEVEKLKKAGLNLFGKGNVSEFGLSMETENKLIAPCKNPINTLFSPGGGASGAAAAVAANMSPWAISTDVSGALRMGASMMGLFGFLPTRGRVPVVRRHLLPYTERVFYRKGSITKDIKDAALLLNILSDYDPRDLFSTKTRVSDYAANLEKGTKLKIAASLDLGFIPVEKDVENVFEETIYRLKTRGHTVERVSLDFSSDLLAHFKAVFSSDRYLMITPLLEDNYQKQELLTNDTKSWLKLAEQVSGIHYSLAIAYIGYVREKLNQLFEKHSLLLTPAIPVSPWLLGKHPQALDPFVGLWSFLIPFNMSGHPALVFPAGKSIEEMPIGMQLIAGEFQEEILLQAGKGIT